jgi:triacylglycerol lipase
VETKAVLKMGRKAIEGETMDGLFFKRFLSYLVVSMTALLVSCSGLPPKSGSVMTPIVFVHGNGDTAGIWQTLIWRFESNGWPTDRLSAIDMPYPLARDNDLVEQPGRSSTQDQANALAEEVTKVLQRTMADRVILIASSRGGFAVRNYIQNKGGDRFVSHAILGGVPNHGVWAIETRSPQSEFNGTGAFLKQLNLPKNAAGDEVTGPVKWLTLRSDNNDKFAQPDGLWIGSKGLVTNVSFDAPALKGATNIVLPARDHREVAFHPQAFAAMFEFVTGKPPEQMKVVPATQPVLNGQVSQLGLGGVGDYSTNVPLTGALVQVYAVDSQGVRANNQTPVHSKTTASNGQWGPFQATANQGYEFVITAPGYAITHIYRSAFARSSDIVNMRPGRIAAADKTAFSVATLNRSRGYFGLGRDEMSLDGHALPGIVAGVAGTSAAKLVIPSGPVRSVTGVFNGERISGQTWPASENHLVILDLHD